MSAIDVAYARTSEPDSVARPAASWTGTDQRLGRRWMAILGAGLVAVVGLALGWNWLLAAGILPILLSAAPCLAMCALHLCAAGSQGSSCSKNDGAAAAISGSRPS